MVIIIHIYKYLYLHIYLHLLIFIDNIYFYLRMTFIFFEEKIGTKEIRKVNFQLENNILSM